MRVKIHKEESSVITQIIQMKIKKSTRYILATILIIIMIIIISSLILRYHVKPREVYYIEKMDHIEDGGFENFNSSSAGDCCNANPNKSLVYASKSKDAIEGEYSLNLTSENQCSCTFKSVQKFDRESQYLLFFYYKGYSPRLCVWAGGDQNCIKNDRLIGSKEWKKYIKIITFTNKSIDSNIVFYADSDGTETTTNLYDDLQFHQLVQMDTSYTFKPNEQYIIKTDSSNIVHNGDPLNEAGYYLLTGKPDITLRFPWPELILLLFMMLVVIRLLFKKQTVGTEKAVADTVRTR